MSALASFILNRFDENRRFRFSSGMDKEILLCKYASQGEYTPEEIAKREREGMPIVYVPLTDEKRRAALAWVSEIFLNTGEKTYTLKPSPIPDMPEAVEQEIAQGVIMEWAQTISPEPPQTEQDLDIIRKYAESRRDELTHLVEEEARKRAERLDKVIHDRLFEARWREQMTIAMDYIATYGTAVVKLAPRRRKRLVRKTNKYGVSSFEVKWDTRLELKTLDPNDCYPSKGARDIHDGYFCHRVRYEPLDLEGMLKQPNVIDDAIREILSKYNGTGIRTYLPDDSSHEALNHDGSPTDAGLTSIEGVEFWGTVPGNVLILNQIEKDSKGEAIESTKFYDVNCVVVDGLVIYCEMLDPRLGRPLFKGVFYNLPSSWWGESPAKKMRPIQSLINSTITSMAWNMGMAAGPQVAITDVERLQTKDFTQRPWKVWVFRKGLTNTSDVPIKFFQPNSNSSELMQLYDRMRKEADSLTGIPAYSYGSDIAAGAGRTATGLSILMDSTNRSIKHYAINIDQDMNQPIIQYLINFEMINSDDEGIKGDVMIDAGGLLAVISKDKCIAQLQEILMLAQNPLVANVIGDAGINEIMRRMVALIPNINPDKIVPTEEEMEYRKLKAQLEQVRMQQMQQQMQLQGQMQAQAAGLNLPQGGAPQGALPQGGVQPPQMMDGMVPITSIPGGAAVGGNTPGSTFNQYQPNQPAIPAGDVEMMA